MNRVLWPIPKIWPNSTVFIIGGGPSIKNQNLDLIKGHRVIGVNQAWTLGPWVDLCWFGDKGWLDQNTPEIWQYGGLIVTCCNPAQQLKRIKYVARSKRYGLETNKRTHIGWNDNSGASAINVAYWLGARRVILLGFEMRNPIEGTQTHWHNKYAPKIDKKTKKLSNPYSRFLIGFPQIAKDAKEVGLEIINATPDSALKVFPYKPLEEICQDLI